MFRIAQEEHLQRHQLLETRRLAKCYINFIGNHREQVLPLFELLSVARHKTRCDYTFVKDFYVDVVADKYTVEEKKKVSRHSKALQYENTKNNDCQKTHLLVTVTDEYTCEAQILFILLF